MTFIDRETPLLERRVSYDDGVRRGALACVPAKKIRAVMKGKEALTVRELLALPLDITATFGGVMHADLIPGEFLHLFAVLMAQTELDIRAKAGTYIDFRANMLLKAKSDFATFAVSRGVLTASRTIAARAREDVLALNDNQVVHAINVCMAAALDDPRDAVLMTLAAILDQAENRKQTARRLLKLAVAYLEDAHVA